MRLLVLGGTRFVGRHLVAAALESGHQVTLFQRGLTHPEIFPRAEKLHGDRDGDLSLLAGRRWDAVVDCSAYRPRQVEATARTLGGAVDLYVLVSTISVYADFAAGPDEGAALAPPPPDPDAADAGYGPLKALCEQAAAAALPGRLLVVRPGVLVGPHDPGRRLAYWPLRLAVGGEVLAPGRPEAPLQLLDARDLAAWLLLALDRRSTGTYNATSPRGGLTFGELLATCLAVTGAAARLTWVGEEFLTGHDVVPFRDLPLWVAEEDTGFYRIDSARALAAGLRCRPLAETVRDALAAPGDAAETPARLAPEREAELLRAWHQRGSMPHA